jgi:hypothetical protein
LFTDHDKETEHNSLSELHNESSKETNHNSHSGLKSDEFTTTHNDNVRNKIMTQTDVAQGDTTVSRSTENNAATADLFSSPQDQGLSPTELGINVVNPENFQSPDNMGVREMELQNDARFQTTTQQDISGSTSTNNEGKSHTSKESHSRVDENDVLKNEATTSTEMTGDNDLSSRANDGQHMTAHNNLRSRGRDGSEMEANNDLSSRGRVANHSSGENNLGSSAMNETSMERFEDLNMWDTLQAFWDLYSDRIAMEIDNRLIHLFLNMKINRFVDYRMNSQEYL